MDIRACLKDFWLSKGDNAIGVLRMKGQEIKHYIDNGIVNNPFKFFKIATILEGNGYKVDNFSDLPKANREAIAIILAGQVSIDDYVREASISRDSFLRYLKMSPGASTNAPQLIAAATLNLQSKGLIIENAEKEESSSEVNEKPNHLIEFDKKSEGAPEKKDFVPASVNHDLVLNLIITMAANATLLDKILEDYLKNSSVQDRIAMRDVLSRTGFSVFQTSNLSHHLTNKLNALCSEKALENYVNKK
jgi:hypothetical protein